MEQVERIEGQVIYDDYPAKYAKKVDWWKTEQGLSLIRGWRSQGKTIKQVVELMGVDPRTFKAWRKKYTEFDEAMTVGAEVANANIANSLYKKACGYDYWEEVWDLVEGEMRLVRKYKKHMPPDTKAMLAWLYNRMPNQWRTLQEPLEKTQYVETVKNILIAMKDVAEGAEAKQVEVKEDQPE